ncbi:MAG: PIN domain-containing protein [Nitrososphaerota archaeon]|nr:PIN domain-containing protein [Nitrososphaerota archaeon]
MNLQITLDTTFFVRHYFSKDARVLQKTKEILRRSVLQGSRGIIPTIVLSEFYSQAAKRAGAAEAERRFNEILDFGLEVVNLDATISKKAGVLRHKYEEKLPWGDCLIATTGIESKSHYIITEDPEFKSFGEIKSRTIENVSL